MLTKKNIDKMLEMPDDRLAAMLKLTLAASGADTTRLNLDEKTVRKLRAVLGEVTWRTSARRWSASWRIRDLPGW